MRDVSLNGGGDSMKMGQNTGSNDDSSLQQQNEASISAGGR